MTKILCVGGSWSGIEVEEHAGAISLPKISRNFYPPSFRDYKYIPIAHDKNAEFYDKMIFESYGAIDYKAKLYVCTDQHKDELSGLSPYERNNVLLPIALEYLIDHLKGSREP